MLFNHATFLQKFDFSCAKSWFWSDPIQTYKTVETLFFAFPKVDFLDKNEDLEQCARLVQIEKNIYIYDVCISGLIPSIGNDNQSKQRFGTMSSLLWELSMKYEHCFFLSTGKLFVENGQVNPTFYKDNYHLNILGSKLLSQRLSMLSKEIYEQFN